MTKQEFDNKYRKNGGIKMLETMTKELQTLRSIANNFGVGREVVRRWCVELLGKTYDPRGQRAERAIKSMLEYCFMFGEHQCIETFRHGNKEYLKQALEIYKRKKYKNKNDRT